MSKQANTTLAIRRSGLTGGAPLTFLLAAIASLTPPSHAQPPAITWVRAVSGPGDDYGWGVAVDRANNVFATGHFFGPATVGGTTLDRSAKEDTVLAKFDSAGNLRWVRQAGAAEFDEGRGVTTDADGNAYVTGSFTGTASFGQTTLTSAGGADIFLAKYDGEGNLRWGTRGGGSSDDLGRGVATDAAANVLLAGHFKETASFADLNLVSAGGPDIVVAKFDPQGKLLWARAAGGAAADEASAVTTDSAGNVYVTGSFTGAARFGELALMSHGGSDVFIAKYDPLGQLLWVKSGGGATQSSSGIGFGLAVEEAGGVYVTGVVTGDALFDDSRLAHRGQGDVFVAKYAPDGQLLWAQSFGDVGPDQGRGVGVDAHGNLYVAGFYLERITFGATTFLSPGHADVFVAKLSSDGRVLWAVQAGGTAYKAANGLAVSPQGACFITGFHRGSTAFGGFSLTNNFPNNRDLFVARVDGPSNPRLGITRAGSQVLLSWPASDAGFQLESTEGLPARTGWSRVPRPPAVVNGSRLVTDEANGPARFYRLRAP
ncbi:MAG: SBBP repeat-containing protein [Verrucomicrobia bacterium]|nr:SBBP repeat-containing protein [Verrucomicrobiota bacterium]